jgi:Fic family protein
VILELTSAQVDRVLRHALGTGNMSLLLSGLSDVRDALEDAPWQLEDERLSRSLLFGLLLLAAFPADRSYIGNAELARILGVNISTAHRYISTLVAVGLLERDPATRKYRLADVG